MTWDDVSATAVTMPLLAAYPREEHVPSKLVGISTTSLEWATFCSVIVKSRAGDVASFKFHYVIWMLSLQKLSNAP